MPTAASIRARWPEQFPAAWDPTNAVLDAAIAEAGRRIRRPDLLGDRLEDAHSYLAAHLAALNRSVGVAAPGGGGAGAVTGPVASMAVGSVSVSYGSGGAGSVSIPTTPGTSDLELTIYGRLYQALLRNTARLRVPSPL